ncbi:ribosome small subunit-dependent GTPase A [Methylobacillus methanolivorans]
MSNALLNGLVIASYGKRYGVELEDGTELSCVTRGKKTDLACGDKVKVKLTGPNEAVVEQLEPRSSLLYRSNSFRSKMLAANVSQAVIVLATQPSFYEELLNRCLVACEAAGVKAVIVLNKCDLDNADDVLLRLQDYAGLGYTIQPLSARGNIAPLKQWLQGETSVLVGQSGMGKSTIVNALLPDKMVRTQEVSTVLDSGKHTTTAAHLYHLDAQSKLIDSPGLQEFGLNHLDAEQLELAFVEFRPYLGQCRFNNCRHLKEPDCAIQAAVDAGAILPRRLGFYQQLRQEMA